MAHSVPTTALLFSGGVDSTVLLTHLLQNGHTVQPIYIRCDTVWEQAEWAAVRRLLANLLPHWSPQLRDLVTLRMPVADLYGDHWSTTGVRVPDATTDDEAVHLPGRNPLLLIKASLWCRLHGVFDLALGTLARNPFDDATTEFFNAFEHMIQRATGSHIRLRCPFGSLSKQDVVQLARSAPLHLTFSCISPVGPRQCGHCNKCAERRGVLQHLTAEPKPTTALASTPILPIR